MVRKYGTIRVEFKRQLNLRNTQDGSGWPYLCTQLYKYAIVKWYPLGAVPEKTRQVRSHVRFL